MPAKKLNILITGCSPGGMGSALAISCHNAGHNVFASARDPSKLTSLSELGLHPITLDITSSASIDSAVSAVSAAIGPDDGLHMLVNNAAASYNMPLADASIAASKALFDVNLWSQLAVTQAFLPLLLRASPASASSGGGGGFCAAPGDPGPMIVNHTSVGSIAAIPFQGVYNASKAALAMMTDTLRMELAPFGVRVVDLKTAGVQTNIRSNSNVNARGDALPPGSIYEPARETVKVALSQEDMGAKVMPAEQWADEVASLLLSRNTPNVIWKGEGAKLARVAGLLPTSTVEGMLKKMTKLDVIETQIKEARTAVAGQA